jgi:hypothetical protein
MFWTIVFAIITAFFGIVLISVTVSFLARLWEDHRQQFLFWTLAFPAAVGVLVAFALIPIFRSL